MHGQGCQHMSKIFGETDALHDVHHAQMTVRIRTGKARGRDWFLWGRGGRRTLSGPAMASTLRKLKSLVLSQATDKEQIADLLDT